MTESSFLVKQITLLCAWEIPESYSAQRRSILLQGFQGVFSTYQYVPNKGRQIMPRGPRSNRPQVMFYLPSNFDVILTVHLR